MTDPLSLLSRLARCLTVVGLLAGVGWAGAQVWLDRALATSMPIETADLEKTLRIRAGRLIGRLETSDLQSIDKLEVLADGHMRGIEACRQLREITRSSRWCGFGAELLTWEGRLSMDDRDPTGVYRRALVARMDRPRDLLPASFEPLRQLPLERLDLSLSGDSADASLAPIAAISTLNRLDLFGDDMPQARFAELGASGSLQEIRVQYDGSSPLTISSVHPVTRLHVDMTLGESQPVHLAHLNSLRDLTLVLDYDSAIRITDAPQLLSLGYSADLWNGGPLNIDPICLPSLRLLRIQGSPISLEPLKNATNLRHLQLSYDESRATFLPMTYPAGWPPFQSDPHRYPEQLSSYDRTDLQPLTELPNLEKLELGLGPGIDYTPLHDCTQLRELALSKLPPQEAPKIWKAIRPLAGRISITCKFVTALPEHDLAGAEAIEAMRSSGIQVMTDNNR